MHPDSQANRRIETVFFDDENSRSLVRILPEMMAKRIRQLWNSTNRHLLGMRIDELRAEAMQHGEILGAIDEIVRRRLWKEYEYLQEQLDPRLMKMNMARVVGSTMGKEVFYHRYLQSDYVLAYILTPPVSYEEMVKITSANATVFVDAQIKKFVKMGITKVSLELAAEWEKTLYNRAQAVEKKSTNRPVKEPEKIEGPPPGPTMEEVLAAEKAALAEVKAVKVD